MTLQLGTIDQSLPGGVYSLPVIPFSQHKQIAIEQSDESSIESEIEPEPIKDVSATIAASNKKSNLKSGGIRKKGKRSEREVQGDPIYEDYLPDIEGSIKANVKKYLKKHIIKSIRKKEPL